MRCRKAQRLISAGLDGELDAVRQRALEGHLGACGKCRAFAADLNASGEMLDGWAAPEPRWGFAGRTLAPIADLQPGQAPSRGWFDFLRPAPLGLGAAAFGFGVALAVLANGEPIPEARVPEQGLEALASDYMDPLGDDTIETSLLALLPETED